MGNVCDVSFDLEYMILGMKLNNRIELFMLKVI